MKKINYNILNKVRIQLNIPNNFNTLRYSYYSALDNEKINYRRRLNISLYNYGHGEKYVNQLLSKKTFSIYDDSYYISYNEIIFKGNYKFIEWITDLSLKNRLLWNMMIFIKPYLKLSMPIIEGKIIDPLIGIIFNDIGYNIVHAASVKYKDRAVIFVARGGGGKTTVSINLPLLYKDFAFLSDNFTILHENYAYPFVEPLNLFIYNLYKKQYESLTLSEKLTFDINKIIYTITKGYVKRFLQLMPTRFTEIQQSGNPISALFIMIQKKGLTRPVFVQIEKSRAIQHIIFNQKLEWEELNRLTESIRIFEIISEKPYLTHFLSNFWEMYINNLYKNLPDDIEYYIVYLPVRVNNTLKDIAKFIMSLGR